MPQLSPLNWVVLSIMILFLVFFTKMYFSFLSINKLCFLGEKSNLKSTNQKWFW